MHSEDRLTDPAAESQPAAETPAPEVQAVDPAAYAALQKQAEALQAKLDAATKANKAKVKDSGDHAAQAALAQQEADEAKGRAAALEAKLAALEPDAKAWKAEKAKQDQAIKDRFAKLPEETRRRVGADPSLEVMRGFVAAFDVSDAGASDAPPAARPAAPMVGPPGAQAPAANPFEMSDAERKQWLSDHARVQSWLIGQGVPDRAAQKDIFGRPLQR